MAVTLALLRSFDVLATLPEAELGQLAAQSHLRKFARRAIVLNAGCHDGNLCFLFEGRLQGVDFTLDGREVGLYFVEPGGFCGELSLFDKKPQPESVIALAQSQVVTIPLSAIRQVMFDSRLLMEALTQRLASRIRDLSAHRGLLFLNSVSQRVCGQLWSLLKSGTNPDAITLPPTHQEMAIMLNISRESVTRVFQTLQAREIVRREGSNLLHIINPTALEALAMGGDSL